jgi:hypothetical protein
MAFSQWFDYAHHDPTHRAIYLPQSIKKLIATNFSFSSFAAF